MIDIFEPLVKIKPQEQIEKLLRETEREGIEGLISHLKHIGFYYAPASTKYHGAYEGALAEHSLNVYNCAYELATAWLTTEEVENIYNSLVICAILHDLGKAGQFGKPLYVENVLKSGKASDAQPFKTNPDLMDLPHEVTSVIEASKYIELTEDEQRAIAWHNGLYGAFKYDIQGKENELYMLIHFADMWASRVLEK